jgi:hypothetical protein
MTDSGGVAPESQTEPPAGRRRSEPSVARKLRALGPEMQGAGIAAAALALTLVLPWYDKSYFAVVRGKPAASHANLSAFGVFSFVEAAVLLVAVGVLYLIWARANERAFHLPGGDGTVLMAAGAWAFLLLVWRLFDKPDVSDPGATVGIQWGIFAAFLAAGALTVMGARVRAAHRPEPPNPVADDGDWQAPPRRTREDRADRRPRDSSAVTEVLRDPPSWQGEPPAQPPPAGRRPDPDPADADTEVRPRRDPSETDTHALPRERDEPNDRLF